MLVALLAVSADCSGRRPARGLHRRGEPRPARRARRARRRPPRARQLRGRRAARTVRVEVDPQRPPGAGAARRGHRRSRPRRSTARPCQRGPRPRSPQGIEVFRPYAGAGGLKEEYEQAARDNPRIAKLVSIGTTVQGKHIVALKVTKDPKPARRPQAGGALPRRPARARVDHARDEPPAHALLPRRLQHEPHGSASSSTRASCGSSRSPTRTATTGPSSRASACGARTCATTTATGGSPPATASTSTATSPTGGATTTRARRPTRRARPTAGPGPNSEPETQALDRFAARVRFEFFVNYHSAAELLLYGVGWQVATPTPDDVHLRGDGRRRRRPGDPRL